MPETFVREEYPIGRRPWLENVELLEGSCLDCPDDWQVPLQRYGYHRLYYIRGGRASYEIDGTRRAMAPGHMYVFPAKTRAYGIQQDREAPLKVLWCHFELVPDITNGVMDVDVRAHPALMSLVEAWRQLSELPMPGNEIKAVLTVILCLMDRAVPFEFTDFPFDGVERHIAEHLAEGLNVTALAGHFGYSRSHFERRFKAAYGLSPGEYLRVVRMSQAASLLAAGHSIDAICARIGFADKKAFQRAFRNYHGVSPGRYRDRFGQNQ